MIKENQKHFNRLQVVIDAFVIVISYVMAWVIKFQILKNDDGKLPFRTYMFAMVCIVAVYLLLYNLFSLLYTEARSGAASGAVEYCKSQYRGNCPYPGRSVPDKND